MTEPDPKTQAAAIQRSDLPNEPSADQRTGDPLAKPDAQAVEAKANAEMGAPFANPDAEAPATVVQDAPEVEGEHYQVGYFGVLPDADNRPDLSLAGVLGLESGPTGATEPEPNPED